MRRADAFSQCHPLLNFFYFLVVMGVAMFARHPVLLAISFIGAFSYGAWLNGVRRAVMQNVAIALPGILVVALTNPLFNHYGVTTLFYMESSGNAVTLEALVYGLVLGCVMFLIMGWFSCYNAIMTSDKFLYLFGRILPALSLALSMALRLVPRLVSQAGAIRDAQRGIGMDGGGGLLKKIRAGARRLSILVTWAIEGAIETADSMRARGYGLPGRTAFSIYRVTGRDTALGIWMLSLFAVILCGCFRGAAFASYNPRIIIAGFSVFGREAPAGCPPALAALTFAAYGAFCLTPLFLGIAQEASMRKSLRSAGA